MLGTPELVICIHKCEEWESGFPVRAGFQPQAGAGQARGKALMLEKTKLKI